MTLFRVAGDAARQAFELDGPIPRTILGLAYKPHRVAEAYIAGDRRGLLNPVKFCLIMGAIGVLVLQVFDINTFQLLRGTGVIKFGGATPEQTELMAASFDRASNVVGDYRHVFSVLALPIGAVLMWLMFWRAKHTLAEKLVLLLYVAGFLLIFEMVSLPLDIFGSELGQIVFAIVEVTYLTLAICAFERAVTLFGVVRSLAIGLVLFFAVRVLTLLATIGLGLAFIAVHELAPYWRLIT